MADEVKCEWRGLMDGPLPSAVEGRERFEPCESRLMGAWVRKSPD
jgi:hypothetical protein